MTTAGLANAPPGLAADTVMAHQQAAVQHIIPSGDTDRIAGSGTSGPSIGAPLPAAPAQQEDLHAVRKGAKREQNPNERDDGLSIVPPMPAGAGATAKATGSGVVSSAPGTASGPPGQGIQASSHGIAGGVCSAPGTVALPSSIGRSLNPLQRDVIRTNADSIS